MYTIQVLMGVALTLASLGLFFLIRDLVKAFIKEHTCEKCGGWKIQVERREITIQVGNGFRETFLGLRRTTGINIKKRCLSGNCNYVSETSGKLIPGSRNIRHLSA